MRPTCVADPVVVTSSAPEHDAARQRLGWLHDDLVRPGATLADCRKLGEALAQERARVPSAAQAALAADPLASKAELPVEAVMAAPVLIRLRPQAAPAAANGRKSAGTAQAHRR